MRNIFEARAAPLAALGGLVIAAAGLQVFLTLPSEKRLAPNLLIAAGMLVFILGTASLQWGKQLKLPGWLRRAGRSTGLTPIQGVTLVLGGLSAVLAAIASGESYGIVTHFWIMMLAWILGIALIVLGSWQPGERITLPDRNARLIALTLFAGSLIVRVIGLEGAPPLLNGDEASAGLSAVRFIDGETNNPFGVGWFSFPALYYAIQALPIWALGQTTFALRLTSTLIGALTASIVYLVGRKWYSERAGVFAGLFLLGWHFHNHFSRIGLNNIWDAFFFIAGLGLLVIGWRQQRRAAFLGAGLSIGLAQYFYVSSRFLIVVALAWLALAVIFDRKRIRGNGMNVALMALLIIAIILPQAWFFLQQGEYYHFLAPFNRVEMLGDWLEIETELTGLPIWRIMARQLWTSARTFISIESQVWYPAGVPILRPVSAVLFLAGLVLLVFRIKDLTAWMLYGWLALFVVMGGLSVPVSASQRYVAAAPACALAIGYGLAHIGDLIGKAWPSARRIILAAGLILLGWIGFRDTDFYFNEYSPTTTLGGANTMVAQRLADTLQGEDGLQVAFFGGTRMGYYSINSTAYLAPEVEGLDFFEPWGSENNPEITAAQVAFVFLPEVFDIYHEVKLDFPDGELHVEFDQYEKPLYWIYRAENPRAP